jgi:hypothetical protein
MNNLIAICAAIAGTTGILVSLYSLAPQGMWLHLILLCFSVQLIVMAVRSAIKTM